MLHESSTAIIFCFPLKSPHICLTSGVAFSTEILSFKWKMAILCSYMPEARRYWLFFSVLPFNQVMFQSTTILWVGAGDEERAMFHTDSSVWAAFWLTFRPSVCLSVWVSARKSWSCVIFAVWVTVFRWVL